MTTTCPSEWRANYFAANRYAIKLFNSNRDNSVYPRDLVHEAYTYWQDKKGEDLFTKEKPQIFTVLKNLYYTRSQKSKWYSGGKFYPKVFSEDFVQGFPKDEQLSVRDSLLSRWGMEFPKQEVESEEIVEKFRESLSDFDNLVLSLKEEGYMNKEIEKIVNRTNPIITKSIKNIKRKMKEVLLNPFNCSKVKVIHRVNRKTYETNKSAYDKEFEVGEYAEHNEYYVLMTSRENPKEGLLIKEQLRD